MDLGEYWKIRGTLRIWINRRISGYFGNSGYIGFSGWGWVPEQSRGRPTAAPAPAAPLEPQQDRAENGQLGTGTIFRFYSSLSRVPVILGLFLLSLWFPAQLIRGLIRGDGADREVMGKLGTIPRDRDRDREWDRDRDWDWDWEREKDWDGIEIRIGRFQLPLQLVVALLLLVTFVPTLRIVRAGMTKDVVVLLVQFGLVPSAAPAAMGDMEQELATVRHYLWALEGAAPKIPGDLGSSGTFWGLVIASRAFSCPNSNPNVNSCQDLEQMGNPKKGSMSPIPIPTTIPIPCPGLVIQQVIFFLCFVALTFLLPGKGQVLWGHWDGVHLSICPSIPVCPSVHPILSSRSVLPCLPVIPVHPSLSICPSVHRCPLRRALSILTVLLFPMNVLLGVLAGGWRVVISGLYNAIHLCRLDISLLGPQGVPLSPGFHSYCHFLRLEVSQGHPLVRAFCGLILQCGRTEPLGPPRDTDPEEGVQLMHPKPPARCRGRVRRVRARWAVAYTLLRNPSLTACRKSALADPAANGGVRPGAPKP
uniref:Receptor for retinol uptake STRA6 n=1 Tax=Malurus cyaneus samueli TaxID=2593467 RepID=A0A8C5TGC0_9PASS